MITVLHAAGAGICGRCGEKYQDH
ncbi:MAG: hypothetical protein ACK4NR_09320 [Micavibrio sp.]